MFSSRLAWERPPNALAVLEAARRRAGAEIIDLTISNPTRASLPYPWEEIQAALAGPPAAIYDPSPRGLPGARAAIAASYAELGAAIDPAQVVLTASSSESYGFLFKLLCNPGDAVLVPEPSYPLFEDLARLDGVVPVPYRLSYDGVWHIDVSSVADALARAAAARTRVAALIVVNPNNPTGSFVKRAEIGPLARLCAGAGLTLVSDEVFAGYATAADPDRVPVLAAAPALTEHVLAVSLGGLSKACGLPQLKLGWMVIAGPRARAAAALQRLDVLGDAYLSVGTSVQHAAPRLLELGRGVRRAIASRVSQNRAQLAAALGPSSPCTLLPSEGGWSAILRVPAIRSDEAWATTLLDEDGVLVHPGYFFDVTGGTFLIASLLPEPPLFQDGVRRLLARVRV